jgi:tetratricopeptide (TPR) repeat protein
VECVNLGEYERSVKFFERLAGEQADVKNVRLQLAAAYVDKIPTCGGMAAIVSKGTLARQSLDQTDLLIQADDQWWPAVYCRAMNHLHWPRALKHSADAAADFRRCLELQKKDGSPTARSYYVRTYIGLGDALAKNDQFDQARDAWQEGLAAFPNSAELQKRVALKTAAAARAFVEAARNLEQQIDTDFSFLVRP